MKHDPLKSHDQSLELQFMGVSQSCDRPIRLSYQILAGCSVDIHHLTWMVPNWGLSENRVKFRLSQDVISFPHENGLLGGPHFQRHYYMFGYVWRPQKRLAPWLCQLLEATAELLSYLEVSNLDLHPEDVEEASLVACGSA